MFIMRSYLLFLLLLGNYYGSCQKNSFDKFKQDTIAMGNINFTNVVALDVNEAVICIEYRLFKEKLFQEWTGCRKQVKEREHIRDNNSESYKIVSNQIAFYKRQFVVLDSIKKYLKKVAVPKDTAFISYNIFLKISSPFGDFIPALIESGQCIIVHKNNKRQSYIIRQIGSKKTGQMTGVGLSLYFLPGHNNHFWSKMNWVS